MRCGCLHNRCHPLLNQVDALPGGCPLPALGSGTCRDSECKHAEVKFPRRWPISFASSTLILTPMPAMIGSGLDIPNLVSQLVASSRTPTAKRLGAAEATVTTKLSAISQIKQSLGNLKTAMQALTDRVATPAMSTTVGSGAGFSASASATAVPGHYQVEVTRLASAHKLASAAVAADGHPGAGTLSITSGGRTICVDVAATDTLADIAKAINTAADGKGVSASVVSADDGQHLVLAAQEPGQEHQLSISTTGASGLQALADGMQEKVPATDALVKVDGLERTVSGNTVDDLIPGVSLNLTRAEAGKVFAVEVKADHNALSERLKEFAKAWNETNALLKKTSAYQPDTRTASPLTGDSLVRGLQQQLRAQVSGHLIELKALGVSLDKDGQMNIDAAACEKTLADDPGALKAMLGREGDYAKALGQMLDTHLNAVDGTLTLRHQSLDKQVKGYHTQMEALDARMQKLSDLYTAQFTAMERMVTQMQSSASALDQLIAASSPR